MVSTALKIVLTVGLLVLIAFGVLIYGILDAANSNNPKRPNIILIIADDMGYNDVSFHGSNQIPTPNIDALAYNGIIMSNFYTQSICTPSRTALLTGNYPIRSGMQGLPLAAGENRSLPLDMPTMPEHFKRLGYQTHLVGKWHLGAPKRENTPLRRGFDTHYGYWNGFVGYFNFIASQFLADGVTEMRGLDLWDGFRPQWEGQGEYSTEVFTQKSLDIIENHKEDDAPLFLMVAHLAPHTGDNGTELAVPNGTEVNQKFGYIQDPHRRNYAGVVSYLDDSIGRIVEKLSAKQMLDNSIVLFFSDNGAPTVGTYQNAGSNWPLRGQKQVEFQGGVKGTGAIFSPLLKKTGYVNKQLIHISDFLPTFYAAAGGDVGDLGRIDGVDQWEVLSQNKTTTRVEILTNINELFGQAGLVRGKYKIVNGTYLNGTMDQYYGEAGRGPEVPHYDPEQVLTSRVNLAVANYTKELTSGRVLEVRRELDLSWCRLGNYTPYLGCVDRPCLFDLEVDPCETTDLFQEEPVIGGSLWERILYFYGQLVPLKNRLPDPNANPVYYNNSWCTWLDDEWCFKTPLISTTSS